MKLLSKISLSLVCLGLAPLAQAADFEDTANVVSVAPQIQQVNQPRQECYTEYVNVQTQQRGSAAGGIIGGLAGGLLGNQVGGGNGRTAATAVGAITGAIVGDRMDNQGTGVATSQQPVNQCRMVDSWEQRTTGYLVTYEYRGITQTAVLPYDPGRTLNLRVSLSPAIGPMRPPVRR